MDYTPLKWGMSTNSVRSIDNSTWAQQLALTVAFETGEFHPSDTPENLDYSVAEPVLKMLPVAWDDIKCLDAQPDNYVTIARKKGNNWWVATITNGARTATISTDYLDAGKTYLIEVETLDTSGNASERTSIQANTQSTPTDTEETTADSRQTVYNLLGQPIGGKAKAGQIRIVQSDGNTHKQFIH